MDLHQVWLIRLLVPVTLILSLGARPASVTSVAAATPPALTVLPTTATDRTLQRVYLTDPARNRVVVREFAADSMRAWRPGQPEPRPTRTAFVAVGQTPVAIVSDAVHHQVVVANRDSQTLSVFDGQTGSTVSTVPIGGQPTALSIDPTGRRVFVAIRSAGADNALLVLDTQNYAVQRRVPIAAPATALNLSRSRDQLLVSYGARPTPSLIEVGNGAAISNPVSPSSSRVAAGPAVGSTFVVDSQLDAADALPGDGQCRTAAGTCTLRAAVQEANAHPGADTIQLPAGTYTLSIPNPGGADEDQAATGDLDITDNLTLTGSGADRTTIDAGQLDRVLQLIGPIDVNVSSISLRNNLQADSPEPQAFSGGVLLNTAAHLDLNDVSIDAFGLMESVVANLAAGRLTMTGGGIHTGAEPVVANSVAGLYNAGQATLNRVTLDTKGIFEQSVLNDVGATLTIAASSIYGTVDFGSGGGINNSGMLRMSGGSLAGVMSEGMSGAAFANGGTAILEDLSVQGECVECDGGAIASSGPLELRRVTVRGRVDTAGRGGAIIGTVSVFDSDISNSSARAIGAVGGAIAGQGAVRIISSTLTNNEVGGTDGSSGDGGAIGGAGTLEIADSTINGNSASATENAGAGADAHGGAVAWTGSVTITRSTLASNVASGGGVGHGGAIAGSGALTIVNSTITGNGADGDAPTATGGAISFSGPVTITNSTIVENTVNVGNVGRGAGAGLDGPASLLNTIIARNTVAGDDGTREANCQVPVVSLGHNLSSDRSCGLTAAGDLQGVDPQLAPLADNGGATQTRALLPGSPAIDAGTNAGCPVTDQRGVPRPLDGNRDGVAVCDIGAFELQPPADTRPPVTAASLNPLPNAAGWERTDTTVVLAAQDEPGGSGVKAITFSATGAQSIPNTTIAGSSASVSVVAEGLTTVTFFATDRAGNQEPSRALSVKIDTTAPEAMLRFDPSTKDVLVVGRDALSGVDPTPVSPTTESDVSASLSAPAPLDSELLSLPQLQDVRGLVQGRLAAESATSSKQLRTYVIHDQAGNPTTLVLGVRQIGGTLAVDARSVQYANGPVLLAPTNSSEFVWPALTAPTNRTGFVAPAQPDALAATSPFLLQHMQVGQGTVRQSALAFYRNAANETMLVLSDPPAGQRVTRQPGLVLLQLVTHKGQLTIEH